MAERRVFSACPSCRAMKRHCWGKTCRARSLECVSRFTSRADIGLEFEQEPPSRGCSPLTASNSKPETGWGSSYSADHPASDASSSLSSPTAVEPSTIAFDEASLANVDPRLLVWDESKADGVPTGRGTDENGTSRTSNNSPIGYPASDAPSIIPVLTAEEPSEITITSSGTSTPFLTTQPDTPPHTQRANKPGKRSRSVRRSARIQGFKKMEATNQSEIMQRRR